MSQARAKSDVRPVGDPTTLLILGHQSTTVTVFEEESGQDDIVVFESWIEWGRPTIGGFESFLTVIVP